MSLAGNAFTYWKDGSNQIVVTPELHDRQVASPFVVRLSGQSWIPVNVLVFGVTKEDARHRVFLALQECAEKHYVNPVMIDPRHRAAHILEELGKGQLTWEVSSLDKATISEIGWADR